MADLAGWIVSAALLVLLVPTVLVALRQRRRAAEAEGRLREADELGRTLAHDVLNLTSAAQMSLSATEDTSSPELEDVALALQRIEISIERWRLETRGVEATASALALVMECGRRAAAGLEVRPRVDGALPSDGPEGALDAAVNALLDAAMAADDGALELRMTSSSLRVLGRAAPPAASLAAARSACERVGWEIVSAPGAATIEVRPHASPDRR